MMTAIRNSWALLAGMFLLMVGNGLQGTVLGVRNSSAIDAAALSTDAVDEIADGSRLKSGR